MNKIGEPTLHPLAHAHLLVSIVPYYLDADGGVWLDRLWHRDFEAHFRYLRRVTMAAPCIAKGNQPDLVKLEVPADSELRLIELPVSTSTASGIKDLPTVVRALWRSVGQADVVHSSVVGWPYPLGWIANPIAMLRKKSLFIVVESAPWRLTGSAEDSWRRRVRTGLTETLARFFVNNADLALFTQPSYRDSLMTRGHGDSVVLPASWIEERDILSDDEVERAWKGKRARPPRFLFAGRLTPDKGVEVLLRAVDLLDERGCPVEIDIIGEGPLRDACAAAAEKKRAHVQLRALDPVAYGAPFLSLLRDYDAVIVPSLSDEQPRIVFDAFSQAVPVISSRTDGLVAHVHEGATGFLFARGDAAALATTIDHARQSPGELQRMGTIALARAKEMTLTVHHDHRWRALSDLVGKRGQASR